MKQPEFPQEFVRDCCPKVQEARHWAKMLSAEQSQCIEFADCAFTPAGAGMQCENCDLHLTRPYCGRSKDEKWLPIIEEYYRKVQEWAATDGQTYSLDNVDQEFLVKIRSLEGVTTDRLKDLIQKKFEVVHIEQTDSLVRPVMSPPPLPDFPGDD